MHAAEGWPAFVVLVVVGDDPQSKLPATAAASDKSYERQPQLASTLVKFGDVGSRGVWGTTGTKCNPCV